MRHAQPVRHAAVGLAARCRPGARARGAGAQAAPASARWHPWRPARPSPCRPPACRPCVQAQADARLAAPRVALSPWLAADAGSLQGRVACAMPSNAGPAGAQGAREASARDASLGSTDPHLLQGTLEDLVRCRPPWAHLVRPGRCPCIQARGACPPPPV